MFQTEIESSTEVLAEDAQAKTFGWARRPLFLYNPEPLSIPGGVITEFDMYTVFSTTYLFVFELVNNGWTRYILITAFSVREKKLFTKIINMSAPIGSFSLPNGSEAGSIRIKQGGAAIYFIIMDQGCRILKIDAPHFGGENALRGELVLTGTQEGQSIVTNLPWKEKSRFQYLRCSPWFAAEGVMRFENKEIVFSKNRSWCIFLWGRIARPKADMHYWAAGCGRSDDKQVSFSIGYGNVDSEYATENAFFINGKLHKLEYVTFKISPHSWTHIWFFSSSDGRLQMKFKPLGTDIQRYASIFHSLSVRRVYGVFSGKFLPSDGACVYFRNITGIAECKKTRN